MIQNIAIYPGFFDPLTLGHQNIVERASRVFESIIVAVASDSPKAGLFTWEERIQMIHQVFENFPNVRVEAFSGLLVNYMQKNNYKILLRGIRTVSDFEYEYQMALANKVLTHDIETFFMMTEGQYSYLSSTIIKEVARLGGDVSEMVPTIIAEYVRKKYEI